jgi:hypothetical protein
MFDEKILELYLAYVITKMSEKDSKEILLLARRIQYLTSFYSEDDSFLINEKEINLERLVDVDNRKKVVQQLKELN